MWLLNLPFNFSQKVTNDIVDQVLKDADQSVLEIKQQIENMWISCAFPRMRRTMASQIPGFTFGGDNVGKPYTCEDIEISTICNKIYMKVL